MKRYQIQIIKWFCQKLIIIFPPIKKDELTKKIYKTKNNNSNKKLFNSSIDIKASSSSINVMDSIINKMKKNNYLSKKNSEKNCKKKINYNPDIKKYY